MIQVESLVFAINAVKIIRTFIQMYLGQSPCLVDVS